METEPVLKAEQVVESDSEIHDSATTDGVEATSTRQATADQRAMDFP